jgi:hypothetical protein
VEYDRPHCIGCLHSIRTGYCDWLSGISCSWNKKLNNKFTLRSRMATARFISEPHHLLAISGFWRMGDPLRQVKLFFFSTVFVMSCRNSVISLSLVIRCSIEPYQFDPGVRGLLNAQVGNTRRHLNRGTRCRSKSTLTIILKGMKYWRAILRRTSALHSTGSAIESREWRSI